MTPLRAVVADDEELARRGLRLLLARVEAVDVVAEARNGRQAVDVVRRLTPDVLFLDVEMPGLGGFDVVRELKDALPHVVFVTAHDRYAVRAFEVHALDYLVKPVEEERVRAAVQRARAALRGGGEARPLAARVEALVAALEKPAGERFVVRQGGRVRFVQAAEVDWVEAQGDYVGLHVGRHLHLLRDTIASMERRLDPRRFARIHRSTIVNLERVAEMRALDDGEYQVVLQDGTLLKLSRSFRPGVERLLGSRL